MHCLQGRSYISLKQPSGWVYGVRAIGSLGRWDLPFDLEFEVAHKLPFCRQEHGLPRGGA